MMFSLISNIGLDASLYQCIEHILYILHLYSKLYKKLTHLSPLFILILEIFSNTSSILYTAMISQFGPPVVHLEFLVVHRVFHNSLIKCS